MAARSKPTRNDAKVQFDDFSTTSFEGVIEECIKVTEASFFIAFSGVAERASETYAHQGFKEAPIITNLSCHSKVGASITLGNEKGKTTSFNLKNFNNVSNV
jgi:hypothetical protein